MIKDEKDKLATLQLSYKNLGQDHCIQLLSRLTTPAFASNIKLLANLYEKDFEDDWFFKLLPNDCFLQILEYLPLSSSLHVSDISTPFNNAVHLLLQRRRYLRNCAVSGFENRGCTWPTVIGAGNWSRRTLERCLEKRREVLMENGIFDSQTGFEERFCKLKRENKPVTWSFLQLYNVNKDIGRTLSRNLCTKLRVSLSRILGAYALSDPAVGYVQGVNYFTVILLLSMADPYDSTRFRSRDDCKKRYGDQTQSEVTSTTTSESPTSWSENVEDETAGKPTPLEYIVFAVLDQLMRYNNVPQRKGLHRTMAPNDHSLNWSGVAAGGLNSKYGTLGYGLRYYFVRNLPRATISFVHLDMLIEHYIPDLHMHFNRLRISPEIFCAEWYFTLFSYTLPIALTKRVWDVYLIDGAKALHRFALTLLARLKPVLLFKDYVATLDLLKSAKSIENANLLFFDANEAKLGDGFIKQSFKYKVTNRSLHILSSVLLEIVSSRNLMKEVSIMRLSWRRILMHIRSLSEQQQVSKSVRIRSNINRSLVMSHSLMQPRRWMRRAATIQL